MTDQPTPFEALAAASSAMLTEHHVADVLAQLMSDCLLPLSAQAAAILVVDSGGSLALLSASSHRATEVEMLQTQQSQGPCIDTIRSGERTSAVGKEMAETWDLVGQAILDAGYESVHAFPMHWHGQTLGGLNIFRTGAWEESEDDVSLGQAFADVATLVLVQAANVPVDQVAARIHEAIAARSAIEQAKGVLAYLHHVDMEQAYALLEERMRRDGGSLTETARQIVREQHA